MMLDALEIPPNNGDPLFWTDFIELRAIVHPDKCFSFGDLNSLTKRSKDTSNHDYSVSYLETKWNDLINFASIRQNEFGTAYPFQVSTDGDTLQFIRSSEIHREKRLYLSLLFASLLRHFPRKEISPSITRHFEEISFQVFKKLMPSGSETHATWAGGGESARYQGTLFEKMTKVADDIRCNANFKERDFKKNDTGDGGIDLISWHPMDDDREGLPIAFAQCGCSKSDWKFKHLEASPDKHLRQLPVMHRWSTYYFMPLDLREADGDWAHKSDIGSAIIVDRLRITRLAHKFNIFPQLPSLEIIDSIINESHV